jgi:CBS domain-containing protein
MRVQELMCRNVQYCSPDDRLDRVAQLMWDCDCGSVPVCAGDGAPRVVGMITDRDICMSALFEGKPLRDLDVSTAMSRQLLACRPSDQPARVEEVMRQRQIRRVPVTDESRKLLGIVSLADLARAARSQSDAPGITETEVGDTLAEICAPPGELDFAGFAQRLRF